MKQVLTFLIFLISSYQSYSQSYACEGMLKICPSEGIQLSLNIDQVAQDANSYGCLSSQPNPTWTYFEIENSGDIHLFLIANMDVDFIIYGPFSDEQEAYNNCGLMGLSPTANIVDCSYSATSSETPSIYNAIAGEVYVMMITNYSNLVQDANIYQSSGNGSTTNNCNAGVCGVLSTGTFTLFKNDITQSSNLIPLCDNDSFKIVSNGDYLLPNDTIPNPAGDSLYTAQLMWLIYNQNPIMVGGNVINPLTDPGFMGTSNIIPFSNIMGANDSVELISPALLPCNTYFFVPVVGDDGIGGNNNVANGLNDNGTLFWDTDGNGCYAIGDPIEVRFGCSTAFSVIVDNIVNSSCSICTDGMINLFVMDSTGSNYPFSFIWSNGETTQNINSLTPGEYSVEVISSGGCSAFYSFTVGDNFADINEIDFDPFLIFPNPANSKIFIEVHKNITWVKEVQIINMQGQIVFKDNPSAINSNNTINLEGLRTGMYYVNIISDSGLYTKKLIIE